MKEDNIIRGRDAIDRYCKAKGINLADLSKPEFMEKVMNRYAFKDWDSVLASIGHGGLKEGQVINKMLEEREKKLKREITDAEVLDGIADTDGRSGEATVRKNKSGIVVKGLHDLAVRFSRCCNPVPGDEIVGFVTRGRGVSIHRTDCINVINLPEDERGRLIDAEWQVAEILPVQSSIPLRSRSSQTTVSAFCRYFKGIYRKADRYYFHERAYQQAGPRHHHYDL